MSRAFQIIAGLTITHGYFNGEKCPILQCSPDTHSRSLMKKFGIIIRNRVDGVDLFADKPLDFNYIEKVAGQDFIKLQLNTTAASFYTITDLPIGFMGAIQYDSTNVTQEDALVLTPNYEDTEESLLVGAVTIRFSTIENGQAKNLAIDFKSRSTRWIYYIINSSELKLDQPRIDAKGDITFSAPTEVTAPNGQQAMCFRSEEQIPLLQDQEFNINLMNDAGANGNNNKKSKLVLRGVPYAVPSSTQIMQNKGKTEFASHIYVYV